MDRARSLLDEADFRDIGRPRPPRRRSLPGKKAATLGVLLLGLAAVTLWNLGYLSRGGGKAAPLSPELKAEFDQQKGESEARFKRGEIGRDGA